jgi:hypothetical protein
MRSIQLAILHEHVLSVTTRAATSKIIPEVCIRAQGTPARHENGLPQEAFNRAPVLKISLVDELIRMCTDA